MKQKIITPQHSHKKQIKEVQFHLEMKNKQKSPVITSQGVKWPKELGQVGTQQDIVSNCKLCVITNAMNNCPGTQH